MRRALLALLAGSMSFFASAQLVLKDDHPTQYQVKKGDTLWDISATFLQSPWLWPRLWQANPDIDNPHLIYPGDILRLIWVDGEPRLTRKPVKKLSPKAKVVELKPVSPADDTLLLPFLNQDILVDNKELAELPRVIGASSGRIYLSSSDDVYVNKVLDSKTDWRIYRLGPQFTRSDETEEGEEKTRPEVMTSLILVAEAKVNGESDGISLLRLTSQKREIQPNDIVLPVVIPGTAGRFAPTPAPKKTEASILGHPYGSKYIGLDQVVVLDRGRMMDWFRAIRCCFLNPEPRFAIKTASIRMVKQRRAVMRKPSLCRMLR